MFKTEIRDLDMEGASKANWNGGFSITTLGRELRFYGGPFSKAPKFNGFYKVKVASEQKGDAQCTVEVHDFGVPTQAALLAAVEQTLMSAIYERQQVYAGCGAGIGRTGLFLAAVLKVFYPKQDPVKMVRQYYLSYAVETPAQKQLLADLPVAKLRRKVLWTLFKAKYLRFF